MHLPHLDGAASMRLPPIAGVVILLLLMTALLYESDATMVDASRVILARVEGKNISQGQNGAGPFGMEGSWDPSAIHAIWVQYDAASTPGKADAMLDRVVRAGFNTVLYNIGCGTVVYSSAYLPRASDIQPSFDPLAYVVAEGHARGLKVEAWWCPGYAPQDAPFRKLHPDWDIAQVNGVPNGTHWLDYSLPEVRKFVGDVVVEIAQKYDVDGIQLDYIRYPMQFRNPALLSHFHPDDVPSTVHDAYQRLKATRPNVLLTAAVLDSQYRSATYMQHWEQWLAGGYIDYVMPMAYFGPGETRGLEQDLKEWRNLPHPERIAPGLSVAFSNNEGDTAPKTPSELAQQIQLIQAEENTGYAIFDEKTLTGDLATWLGEVNNPPLKHYRGMQPFD